MENKVSPHENITEQIKYQDIYGTSKAQTGRESIIQATTYQLQL